MKRKLFKASITGVASVTLCFFLSTSALSHPAANTCQEDLSYLFCEALDDDAIYEEYQYRSYKRLVPGQGGWIFRSGSDFKTDFSLSKNTIDQIAGLSKAFEAKGTKLIILYIPTRGLMHSEMIRTGDRKKYGFSNPDRIWKNYWASIKAMKAKGINVVGVSKPDPGESFYYKRDHHWNADGAKRSAGELAAFIRALPEYENMEKTKFLTHEGDRFAFYGVSKKIFKKICDTVQPPEIIFKPVTDRKESASDTGDLFGETKIPDVVLMGTSNSTQEPAYANFEGFLKEELSVDILNMSISGGGLDTAVLSYLHSDYFRNNPARIAIWEIPSYYDISAQTNFFRESIPAAYGDCGESAIAANRVKDADGMTVVFPELSAKKIRGEDYYLHFTFSKPVLEPVTVHMNYAAGRADRYRFRRSARQDRADEFYLTLTPERKGMLSKISLSLPPEAIGADIEAKICRISASAVN